MSVTKVIGDLDEAVRTYDDFEERTANDSLWGLVEIFDEDRYKPHPVVGQWGLKEALMKNDLLCTILGGPPVSSFQKR